MLKKPMTLGLQVYHQGMSHVFDIKDTVIHATLVSGKGFKIIILFTTVSTEDNAKIDLILKD